MPHSGVANSIETSVRPATGRLTRYSTSPSAGARAASVTSVSRSGV